MAWNGSTNAGGASIPAPRKTAKKSPSLAHGLIAGGVIILIGIIALYFIGRENDEPVAEKKMCSVIADARPDVAVEKVNDLDKVKALQQGGSTPQTRTRLKTGEIRDGMIMMSDGKMVRTNDIIWARKDARDMQKRFKYAIFDHATDNELAALVTLEGGSMLVGGPLRHANFEKDFLKSLETPIVVSDNDPDDVKIVKRAVQQARMDLKVAYDNGENVKKLINDAYTEAQKLTLYKEEIKSLVSKQLLEDEISDADIDILIDAANKMLEAKGVSPIKLGPVARARLKVMKR